MLFGGQADGGWRGCSSGLLRTDDAPLALCRVGRGGVMCCKCEFSSERRAEQTTAAQVGGVVIQTAVISFKVYSSN